LRGGGCSLHLRPPGPSRGRAGAVDRLPAAGQRPAGLDRVRRAAAGRGARSRHVRPLGRRAPTRPPSVSPPAEPPPLAVPCPPSKPCRSRSSPHTACSPWPRSSWSCSPPSPADPTGRSDPGPPSGQPRVTSGDLGGMRGRSQGGAGPAPGDGVHSDRMPVTVAASTAPHVDELTNRACAPRRGISRWLDLPSSTDRVARHPTGRPRTMPGHHRAERPGRVRGKGPQRPTSR
jgi:hypothetical protein